MIGWLDACAGASGDMLLGALVDAGVPLAVLQSTVDALAVGPVRLSADQVHRHGIGATRVRVEVPAGDQPHRDLAAVRSVLDAAELAGPVRDTARAAFARLAAAEAAVHRTEPERVHFHEVGALDALADIVGACAGVHWLREHRGLAELAVGPVEVGSGGAPVPSAHGTLPVPVPAVVELARRAGLVLTGRLPYEACTPTGMALLATLTGGQRQAMPPLVPETVGVGAGGRDPAEAANVLRLVLGRPAPRGATPPPGTPGAPPQGTPGAPGAPGQEPAVLIECNVDDLDPRLWPAVLAALLDAGASDAWLSPILMKKGRPAHTLHVLCPHQTVDAVRGAIFTHTTSIGLRTLAVTKHPLERQMSTVDVDGQPVAVKLAMLDGVVVNASVEYEDVLRAAAALGRPAKVVLARATAAAQAVWPQRPRA